VDDPDQDAEDEAGDDERDQGTIAQEGDEERDVDQAVHGLRCGVLGRRRLVDDRAVRPPPPPLPAPRRLPLYRRAGHALRAILTDGGSEDRGVCHQACAALGIEHRRAQPRQAWTKGFVERLQGTILTER
jgi:hypothetical protein